MCIGFTPKRLFNVLIYNSIVPWKIRWKVRDLNDVQLGMPTEKYKMQALILIHFAHEIHEQRI